MDIRDYEYIVKIAELGGITKAAAELFITQPALTRFLQRTEEELGLKLFVRQGHRFLLTEAGRAYVETGRKLIELDKALTVYMEDAASSQKKQVRFACSMGRGSSILRDILPRFYEQHPNTEVRFKAETSRQQMADLEEDKLDMALVTNAEERPAYRYIPLGTSHLVLAVSQDSPLVELAREKAGYPYPVLSVRDVANQSFAVMDSLTRSGGLARQVFKLFPTPPRIKLEITDARGLLTAVEAGLGPAIFLSVPPGEVKVRYLCLEEVGIIEETVSLVMKQDKTISPALQYLIDLLRSTPHE